MISIIIPTYNRNADLERALQSIETNSYFDNEVIVLHPAPTDEERAVCDRPGVTLHCDNSRQGGKRVKSLWGIINDGIDLAQNKYVCWLNDDCLVLKDWDKYATEYFAQQDVALVVLRAKGLANIQEFTTIKAHGTIDCANYAVLDKSLGIRFDEKFSWFHGDSDISLQCVIEHRKRVVATSQDCVIHNHVVDENRKNNEASPVTQRDTSYFKKKWRNIIPLDGTYNKLNQYQMIIYTLRHFYYSLKHRYENITRV